MNILLRSLMLTTAAFAPAAHASEPLFSATPLTDAELSEARGGFTLPGGATINIAAIVSTTIDGIRVLTSELRISDNSVSGSVQTASGVQATVSGAGAGNIGQTVTTAVNEAVSEITTAVENLLGSLGGVEPTGGSETPGATVSLSNSSTAPTLPTVTTNVAPATVSAIEDVVTAATDLGTGLGAQAAASVGSTVNAASDAISDVSDNVAASVTTTGPQSLATNTAAPTTASVPTTAAPTTTVPTSTIAAPTVAEVVTPAAAAVETAAQAAANVVSTVANALPGTTAVPGATTTSTPSGGAAPTTATANIPVSTSTTVNGSNYMNSTVQMADLLVQHSLGSTISSLVVNTGDNRTIDSQLSVNLRLDNVQPLSIGSLGFRIDALGLDASQWRAGR